MPAKECPCLREDPRETREACPDVERGSDFGWDA